MDPSDLEYLSTPHPPDSTVSPAPFESASADDAPLLPPSPSSPSKRTRLSACQTSTTFSILLFNLLFCTANSAWWTVNLAVSLAQSDSCVAKGFESRGLCGWCTAAAAFAALAVGGTYKLQLIFYLVQETRLTGDASFALAHLEDAAAFADGSKFRRAFLGSTLHDLLFFVLYQVQASVSRPPVNFDTLGGSLSFLLNILMPFTTAYNWSSMFGSQLLVVCEKKGGCLYTRHHSTAFRDKCCYGCIKSIVVFQMFVLTFPIVLFGLFYSWAAARICNAVSVQINNS